MLVVQVSDVLAKVVRQQAEVLDLADKRAEVLSCIEEFEAVRAECRWLTEYEHDEMRYKVRPVCYIVEDPLAYLWWHAAAAEGSSLQSICMQHMMG